MMTRYCSWLHFHRNFILDALESLKCSLLASIPMDEHCHEIVEVHWCLSPSMPEILRQKVRCNPTDHFTLPEHD